MTIHTHIHNNEQIADMGCCRTDPVVVDHIVRLATLQHLAVPLCESLWLGDLLLVRVAVEDVVVTLTGGTCPNVSCQEPKTKSHDSHMIAFITVSGDTYPFLLQKSR